VSREIETWLSDSGVGNSGVVDHRSRRPVLSPLRRLVVPADAMSWASSERALLPTSTRSVRVNRRECRRLETAARGHTRTYRTP